MLKAAEILRNNSRVIFLFVGGGHQFGKLAQAVKRRGLTSFRFIDYQDRSVLKFSLGVPDVHWLSLKPEVEGLIVPSKFYGMAARLDDRSSQSVQKTVKLAGWSNNMNAVLSSSPQLPSSRRYNRSIVQQSPTPDGVGQRARTMLETNFTRGRSLSAGARWWKNLRLIRCPTNKVRRLKGARITTLLMYHPLKFSS